MFHQMSHDTKTNPKNPQKGERRTEDRRQKAQQGSSTGAASARVGVEGLDEERRRTDRRRPISTMNPEMTQNAHENTPESLPQGALHRQTPEMWPGENFQSGTSQAQKAEGQTPGQPAIPDERPKQRGDRASDYEDFGESRDRPFGERNRGAGGKIDSTQRDMGQTGQNMSSGRTPEIHEQQGPYGPRRKHRGPVAPGKPLMDDWGKSDKH